VHNKNRYTFASAGVALRRFNFFPQKTEQQKHTTVRLPTAGPKRPNLTDPRDRIRPLTKPVLGKQCSKPGSSAPSPSSESVKTRDNLRNNNLLGRPASKCSVGLLLMPASRAFNDSQRSSTIEKDDAGTTLSSTLDSIGWRVERAVESFPLCNLSANTLCHMESKSQQIQFSSATQRNDRIGSTRQQERAMQQNNTKPITRAHQTPQRDQPTLS
jgi:hypothetical protein